MKSFLPYLTKYLKFGHQSIHPHTKTCDMCSTNYYTLCRPICIVWYVLCGVCVSCVVWSVWCVLWCMCCVVCVVVRVLCMVCVVVRVLCVCCVLCGVLWARMPDNVNKEYLDDKRQWEVRLRV